VTDREARQGQALLMEKACVNCHTIRGSSARGSVGPDLTHLASRETLATGVMKNTLPNLTGWLLDPDNYKPGVNMPNLHLKHDEALAMATYLEALR
jgi:cytochrome c oxidase subunit 2